MNTWIVATPAYGRDYTTQAQVRADWAAGKDFQVQPTGQYVNNEDARNHNLKVEVKFARRTKTVIVS